MIPLSRKGYTNRADQKESSCLLGSRPGTADDHLGMRSAGRGNSPTLSLSFFPPEVQTLPWVAPLISREGFLTVDSFIFFPSAHCLAACSSPSEAGVGENSAARPPFPSLNPLPCQLHGAEGEPEYCVVWRMWRWGFSFSILHPSVSPGNIWAPPRAQGCASPDPRSVRLSGVPLVSGSWPGSRGVCTGPPRKQGQG